MSSEAAKTDDTDNALGITAKEEPRQEDSKPNQVLDKTSYTNQFRCKFCEMTCSDKKEIYRHLQTHSEPNMYECTHCPASFSNITDFLLHFKIHPENNLKCNKCRKTFQGPFTLGKHLESHNYEKLFHCQGCEYNTKDRSNIRTHLKPHREGRFKCDKCEKAFRHKIELTEHRRRRCQDNLFHCNICGRKFDSYRKLDMHLTHNKICKNEITRQSKQTEVGRQSTSSVRHSSGAGTYSGPANPFGIGTSYSGKQISSSPATREQSKKAKKNFPHLKHAPVPEMTSFLICVLLP